jgi:uncharacterized protein YbjT (DUF2867 family)
MRGKLVTIFGGTGFIGQYLLPKLTAAGAMVRLAVRDVDAALPLKTSGQVGFVEAVSCNMSDEQSVREAIGNSDYVVNLIGIIFETGKKTFQNTHVDIPQRIAEACKMNKVKRFVHISAIGANPDSASKYMVTKALGEQVVRKAYPDVTIIRPSVLFGAEDKFFNMFAEMSRTSPFLPIIAGGKQKMQPTYVGDVAEAIVRCLQTAHEGKLYELGGPAVYTFREIVEYIMSCTGRSRMLLSIPKPVAMVMGSVMQLFPNPSLTTDQVKMTKVDNVVREGALGFKELDIKPTAVAAIVPLYLERYKFHG